MSELVSLHFLFFITIYFISHGTWHMLLQRLVYGLLHLTVCFVKHSQVSWNLNWVPRSGVWLTEVSLRHSIWSGQCPVTRYLVSLCQIFIDNVDSEQHKHTESSSSEARVKQKSAFQKILKALLGFREKLEVALTPLKGLRILCSQ